MTKGNITIILSGIIALVAYAVVGLSYVLTTL
jgi:hypothetical protein